MASAELLIAHKQSQALLYPKVERTAIAWEPMVRFANKRNEHSHTASQVPLGDTPIHWQLASIDTPTESAVMCLRYPITPTGLV